MFLPKLASRGIIFDSEHKKGYDQKTKIRGIPAFLPQSQSENEKTTKPGNISTQGSGQKTRAGDTVL